MGDEVKDRILNSRYDVFICECDYVVKGQTHATWAAAFEVLAKRVDHHEPQFVLGRH